MHLKQMPNYVLFQVERQSPQWNMLKTHERDFGGLVKN